MKAQSVLWGKYLAISLLFAPLLIRKKLNITRVLVISPVINPYGQDRPTQMIEFSLQTSTGLLFGVFWHIKFRDDGIRVRKHRGL